MSPSVTAYELSLTPVLISSARRAKLKQAEAKTVSKSARGLGRHG